MFNNDPVLMRAIQEDRYYRRHRPLPLEDSRPRRRRLRRTQH